LLKKIVLSILLYSPKLWAWNKSRITTIKKYVDHLLVIFPFEVEFYKRHNLDVLYVGNPLLDEIKKKQFNFSIVSKSQFSHCYLEVESKRLTLFCLICYL
jgi:lipid-A-disaccharide synthase